MPSAQFNRTFTFPGYGFSENALPVSFDHANVFEVTLPAGFPVTSWVKTDADTAACNLPAGHGQTNGKYDVFWTIAGVKYCRYGLDGTIATNALTLDLGAGDAFPASATTGIVVCKQVALVMAIDGDAIALIGIFLKNSADPTGRGHLHMQDASNATIFQASLVDVTVNGGFTQVYNISAGDTNVFTGNLITQGKASNSSTTASATLYVLSGEDSSP